MHFRISPPISTRAPRSNTPHEIKSKIKEKKMSILFIVIALTFVLLPITCLSILLTLHFKPINYSQFRTTSWNIINLAGVSKSDGEIPTKLYKRRTDQNHLADGGVAGCETNVECGVCLCEIEEGEEIRELSRCKHMYHKDCLDGWVGTGSRTCPMCRGPLAQPAMVGENGAELVLFRFSSFSTSRRCRHDSWWIR